MEELMEIAENLSEKIKNSQEYKRYIEANINLNISPSVKNRLSEYQREVFRIQNSLEDNKSHQVEKLNKEYLDILDNSDVREFLKCEAVMCKILQEINRILIDDLDIEINF